MTQVELAKNLNVSVATISNALNGKGRMTSELRQRIVRMAKEGGYITKRSKISVRRKICVVTEQIEVEFCDRILSGICQVAENNDYNVIIYNMNIMHKQHSMSPPREQLETWVKKLLQDIDYTAAGLIYVAQFPRDVTGILKSLPFPVVYAYCTTTDNSYTVNYDDEQGAFLATSHILDLGRKAPAMISGPINSVPMSNRLTGFQHAIIGRHISFDPSMLRIGNWTMEDGYQLMKDLLKQHQHLDAVFAHNDLMAIGAVQAAIDEGLSVPQDIVVVGFDNLFAKYSMPSLSSVDPNLLQIGCMAMQLIIKIIQRKAPSSYHLKVPCSLITRSSSDIIGSLAPKLGFGQNNVSMECYD